MRFIIGKNERGINQLDRFHFLCGILQQGETDYSLVSL